MSNNTPIEECENNRTDEGNSFKPSNSQFLLLIPTFIYNIICCLTRQIEGFLPCAVTFGSRDENHSERNKPIYQDQCTSVVETHLHALSDSKRQEHTTKISPLIREDMHDMKQEWLEGIDEMDTGEQFEYACTMYSHLLSISGQLPNASFEQLLQSEDMSDILGMLVGLQRVPSRYSFIGMDIMAAALALAFLDNGIVLPENPLVTQAVLQSFNLNHSKKVGSPIYVFPKKCSQDRDEYRRTMPTTVVAQSVDHLVVNHHQGVIIMQKGKDSGSWKEKESWNKNLMSSIDKRDDSDGVSPSVKEKYHLSLPPITMNVQGAGPLQHENQLPCHPVVSSCSLSKQATLGKGRCKTTLLITEEYNHQGVDAVEKERESDSSPGKEIPLHMANVQLDSELTLWKEKHSSCPHPKEHVLGHVTKVPKTMEKLVFDRIHPAAKQTTLPQFSAQVPNAVQSSHSEDSLWAWRERISPFSFTAMCFYIKTESVCTLSQRDTRYGENICHACIHCFSSTELEALLKLVNGRSLGAPLCVAADKLGDLPLHAAVKKCEIEAIEVLAGICPQAIKTSNHSNQTPLQRAFDLQYTQCLKSLLHVVITRDDERSVCTRVLQPMLLLAMKNGYFRYLDLVLTLTAKHNLKIDFNCTDDEQQTAWFHLLQHPQEVVQEAINIMVNLDLCIDSLAVDSSGTSLKSQLPMPPLLREFDSPVAPTSSLESAKKAKRCSQVTHQLSLEEEPVTAASDIDMKIMDLPEPGAGIVSEERDRTPLEESVKGVQHMGRNLSHTENSSGVFQRLPPSTKPHFSCGPHVRLRPFEACAPFTHDSSVHSEGSNTELSNDTMCSMAQQKGHSLENQHNRNVSALCSLQQHKEKVVLPTDHSLFCRKQGTDIHVQCSRGVSQTTQSDSGFGCVAEEPTDDDNDGRDEEYCSRVSEESENEEAQEECTTSLQQRNSSSDKNLWGCMSFANSNHPLEIIRSHFTTYSKCCPKHDIQDIVVIGTTCPASEALGPKRRYSSIKDLRKEDRHSKLDFESSLSREGKSGPVQLLPQQHQPVMADSPVNATSHKKMGSTAAVATETATGTTPEAIPRATLPTEPAPSLSDRLMSGQPFGLSLKPSHSHHQWPRGASSSDNLPNGNRTNNPTDSHHPSLQTLSIVHPPAPHTSSPAFCSAHQHPLSVAEQREHKDRIRTAAELLHAQDYPRIFSLAYEGRPPPNLPPETHIAYVFITGLAYYKLSNHKESLKYFQQCLRLAQECGREGDMALSCIYIGDIEFTQRNYLEAAEQYQRALHRYSRDTVARDFQMILPTQSALCAKRGSALRNASNVVEAIAAYEEAIARAESKKDKLSAHTSLGNLLQSVGENGRAVTEYEHSIQLATELQDFVSLGWAHGNMGNAYLGLYQRDKALHHLEKSLDLTVDHEPTPQAIGRAYNNLGTAYQSLGELEKAEEYYDLSLSQAIYGNDIPGQARVYGNIGNLLMIKKECDRAVPHYTEVLRLSQDKSTVSTARHNRDCAYYEWAESKKRVPIATKPLLHDPQFKCWKSECRPSFISKSIECSQGLSDNGISYSSLSTSESTQPSSVYSLRNVFPPFCRPHGNQTQPMPSKEPTTGLLFPDRYSFVGSSPPLNYLHQDHIKAGNSCSPGHGIKNIIMIRLKRSGTMKHFCQQNPPAMMHSLLLPSSSASQQKEHTDCTTTVSDLLQVQDIHETTLKPDTQLNTYLSNCSHSSSHSSTKWCWKRRLKKGSFGETCELVCTVSPSLLEGLDTEYHETVCHAVVSISSLTPKQKVSLLHLLNSRNLNVFTRSDKYGNAPLHKAVTMRSTEMVEHLMIICPAAIRVTNHDGETPIDLAFGMQHNDIVECLLHRTVKGDPNDPESIQLLQSLLLRAMKNGYTDYLIILLKLRSQYSLEIDFNCTDSDQHAAWFYLQQQPPHVQEAVGMILDSSSIDPTLQDLRTHLLVRKEQGTCTSLTMEPKQTPPSSLNRSEESTADEQSLPHLHSALLKNLLPSDGGSNSSEGDDNVHGKGTQHKRGTSIRPCSAKGRNQTKSVFRPVGSGSSSSDHSCTTYQKRSLSCRERERRKRAAERIQSSRLSASSCESERKQNKCRNRHRQVLVKPEDTEGSNSASEADLGSLTDPHISEGSNIGTMKAKDEASWSQSSETQLCATCEVSEEQPELRAYVPRKSPKHLFDRTDFKTTLTTILHDYGFSVFRQLVPHDLHFLFGLSPWRGQPLSRLQKRQFSVLLKVARCNRSAIPADVKQNLDDLAEACDGIAEETIDDHFRGGGGEKTSSTSTPKETFKQSKTKKESGATKTVDPSQTADYGVFSSPGAKSKGATAISSNVQVADSLNPQDTDKKESKSLIEEWEQSKQQTSTDPGVLHFAHSNHPVEVLRDHFTTYSKCCPRHDIQDIVVISNTCPASEALGPKRRYSSIKDLRKEDRHSQLNHASSLSREGKSGPAQLLPQQNQPVMADSPVTTVRHEEKVSIATVATETAARTMPKAVPRPTLATGGASCFQWLQGISSNGSLVSGNRIRIATDSHHPSLQTLSNVHPPAPHTSSPSFRSAHQHPLSVAEQREHKDRIRTAAELLHAQDYPRIFSLAYEGRPPPNLPPETHIAYVFITGLAYYKLSNNKESLKYFQQCLWLAEECGREGDVTLSCIYIGDIEFTQRNYLEAAKQYQRALHRYSRDTVARDFRMILPTQSALCAKRGSALRNASNVVEAIAAYEEAIARAESKKDKLSAHTSLGNLLQSVGENGRAVTEYEHSIQLATELQDFVSLGWAHGNMGNAYLGLYQRDKALHHLEKSLDLTVDHEPTPQTIGRAYNNLGTAYQSLSELEKAEEYYDLALSQAIYGNDTLGQAENMGNLLMIKKEYERAVPHYTEVLCLSQDKSTVSTACHNRGCAYYEWAESKKKNFLQRDTPSTAPTATKPLLHGPQFEDCEPEYRPPFIPKSIEKYYVQGTKDLDFVIKHHEESLHSIKGSPKGLSLSVSLFETNSRTFHRKQDCLVNMGKFEEALLTAEQSRARTLGELLLKRRGPQLEHQLTSPPSLEQLKSVVARQDCPVVYLSYTGARLLGWVFYPSPSQPSLNMFEVPLSDSEFDGKSFDYHLRYSLNEVLVEKSFEMYKPFKYDQDQNDPVLKLYDLVAQPVMAMFKKLKKDTESHGQPPKKAQKIIIIPDSYTNLLPMTCLLDREEGKFWGDDHYFQIMPSLLTMGILDQLPSVSVSVPVEHQQMLCVVGNPTIPMFTYNGEEWNLGKLPHATKEAEWVSHILNCTPILHEQATKSVVMAKIMNAKVIHLATHGSAAAGFLAFAGMSSSYNETVDAKQMLIYPEEIERLSITPALVVLSGGESGRGVVKADGIQGMARAFILAGAQAVLTTLWRVPDESACIFMQFFYQYLMDGLKGTEALHKAILSVRCFSKYSQYIHWSGYQLTGREIQFSFNRSSATELTARLGNHSIFPQLEIVKQLETAFLNNPRLPTDVQVLRGSPGVKPSEALKDFIHLHHQHFRGGIYWINCRSPQLVEASVEYITKMMGLKDLSNLPDTDTQSTLVVFDFSDKVPLQESPLLNLLKKPNLHIVFISKHYPPPDSLQKEIDRKLLRGARVIDIQPLSTIHTTQRIVHSVLKHHHLASSNKQQATFEDLAEFTTGSPAIIDVVSSLLDSHLEQATDTSTEEALLDFAHVVRLGELTKPQSVVRNRQQRSLQMPASLAVREISRSVCDSISTVQEPEDIWTTNSHYDSWQVITVLVEQCQLSPEERLLLFCLSNLNCSPIPSILVTEMATMITRASHQSHLASSLHTKLEKMNLLKPYPKPVIYHPSPVQHSPLHTDFVYVPQFIAEAIWKDMMSDMDKVMALGTVYKAFQNILKRSPSPIEHSFLVGLCSLLVDSYELHYELVGKECFQGVYRLFLSLRARPSPHFDCSLYI